MDRTSSALYSFISGIRILSQFHRIAIANSLKRLNSLVQQTFLRMRVLENIHVDVLHYLPYSLAIILEIWFGFVILVFADFDDVLVRACRLSGA